MLYKAKLVREIICDASELAAFLILLSENVNELVSIDVLVHLKLLDLVLELFQALCLRVLVLDETLAIGLDFLHLLLKLFNDFFGC